MAALADEGNGRHYFVANASGLPAVFAQEFDDILASVAKEAELAIELAPGVEVAEVFDRSFRREGSKIIVPFGTFSAKQEKTVLVKLRVPADREGSAAGRRREARVPRPREEERRLVRRQPRRSPSGATAPSSVSSTRSSPRASSGAAPRRRSPRRTSCSRPAASARRAPSSPTRSDRAEEDGERVPRVRRSRLRRPLRVAPPSRSIEDFEDQLGAVAAADRNFAPPPAVGSSERWRPAPSATRRSPPRPPPPRSRRSRARARRRSASTSSRPPNSASKRPAGGPAPR